MSTTHPRRSGAQVLIDQLRIHGADTIFGVPGESYLAALDALYAQRNSIRYVICRQEGGAANMAEAYGKLTGKPGVCFGTMGPGVANLIAAAIVAFLAAPFADPLADRVEPLQHRARLGLSGDPGQRADEARLLDLDLVSPTVHSAGKKCSQPKFKKY